MRKSWTETFKAEAALDDATILNQTGSQQGALNRLYYAAFYAVTAVLINDGKQFRTHSGVLASFNRDYVKPGVFPKEAGRLFSRLFNERQNADYQPDLEVDKESVSERIGKVRTLLSLVRTHLKL